MGTVDNCPSGKQQVAIGLKMILLALSLSVLSTVSATTTTMSDSGHGYGSGYGYGSDFDGYGSSIFNDTWGSGSGYGGYGGYGGYWPEDMHCCMMKSVGDKKYHLVDYQEAEGCKKEGMMLPRRCKDACIYTMYMDDSGDLYCFGRGRMDMDQNSAALHHQLKQKDQTRISSSDMQNKSNF